MQPKIKKLTIMKNYCLIPILMLLILFGCSKLSKDQGNNHLNDSSIKSESTSINYDSILLNSSNYSGLLNTTKELTQALIGSNITFEKYKYYLLNNLVDSVYIVANIGFSDRSRYDTIFTFYAENLLMEMGENPEEYRNCDSCGTIQDKLDNYEGLWEAFEQDPNLISQGDEILADTHHCNGWAYGICVAACILAFEEAPPLCIICMWECACQYCGNPQLCGNSTY
jgi:hypothetical protein